MNTQPVNPGPLAANRRVGKEGRKPFGNQVQKLAYPLRSGYHRHWFNDEPGRIEKALEAGYTHVEDKEGKKVVRVVGVNQGGGSLHGYLMEIPQEWYDEDMAAQQKVVDAMDQAIKDGSVVGKPGKDGVYVKSIKVEEGTGRRGS